MPKIVLIGCLLLMLVVTAVFAQDEDYCLHQPTAEEYLAAVAVVREKRENVHRPEQQNRKATHLLDTSLE